MRKLYYMGLESYESRYTLQLTEWNRRVFERRGLDVVYVPGTTIDNSQSISVGQVLDAHGRSFFGMSQIMNLVQMHKNGEITNEDVIYFEDIFQPGIESLPYIFDQVDPSQRPRVFVRSLLILIGIFFISVSVLMFIITTATLSSSSSNAGWLRCIPLTQYCR